MAPSAIAIRIYDCIEFLLSTEIIRYISIYISLECNSQTNVLDDLYI